MNALIRVICFTWLFTLPLVVLGQGWSSPIYIATQSGASGSVDTYIGSGGIIHCVWINGTGSFSNVFYSFSADNGMNWSPPMNVSENTLYSVSKPTIVVDYMERVYVAYSLILAPEYIVSKIRIKTPLGWSNITDLAPTYINASIKDMVVDSDNVVWVFLFWGGYEGSMFYSKIINCSISPFNQVELPVDVSFNISGCVVDSNNDIHCVGTLRYPGDSVYSIARVAYFTYNSHSNQWNAPYDFGFDYCYYCSLDLDSNQSPRIVWREETLQGPIGIYYTMFYANTWLTPTMIADNNGSGQVIRVDNNNVAYLVQREYIGDGANRLYYLSIYNSVNWIQEIIFPPISVLGKHSFLIFNNTMYVFYTSGDDIYASVCFTKKSISPSENEDYDNGSLIGECIAISAYPNPFSSNITFSVESKVGKITSIYIYNIKGQVVRKLNPIIQGKTSSRYEWNGMDNIGNLCSKGIYLCKIECNGDSMVYRIIKSQ